MATPNHIARLYVIVAMLAVFFVLWTNIALHPWTSQSAAAPAAPATVAQIVPTGDDGQSVRIVQTQPSAQLTSAQPVTHTRSS